VTDDLSFAPRDVGPFLRAEPTAEQRGALAGYLRGLANAIENPDPLDLPVRIGQISTETNDPGAHNILSDFDPSGQRAIGRQVKITVGWGTPQMGWDWS
jgi:hypothetical protein